MQSPRLTPYSIGTLREKSPTWRVALSSAGDVPACLTQLASTSTWWRGLSAWIDSPKSIMRDEMGCRAEALQDVLVVAGYPVEAGNTLQGHGEKEIYYHLLNVYMFSLVSLSRATRAFQTLTGTRPVGRTSDIAPLARHVSTRSTREMSYGVPNWPML